jgi:nicotinate-nucleotide adenylyltransferase
MMVGLLGGTFDPIHMGHLDVADAARLAIGLDHILLVPANVPPHRAAPRASAAHRFAMAALAVQDRPELRVSDLEMLSNEPSYFSTTLDRLRARGVDTRTICFVMGADAFREIRTWKAFPEILDRCHFVVVSRPGSPAPALRAALPELSGRMIDAAGMVRFDTGSKPRIILVDAPTAAVSSTDVRRRVAASESIAGLVPDQVARHISKHGLYAERA